MSISHWGFFPGIWTCGTDYPSMGYPSLYSPTMGTSRAVWFPCSPEELVQWQ